MSLFGQPCTLSYSTKYHFKDTVLTFPNMKDQEYEIKINDDTFIIDFVQSKVIHGYSTESLKKVFQMEYGLQTITFRNQYVLATSKLGSDEYLLKIYNVSTNKMQNQKVGLPKNHEFTLQASKINHLFAILPGEIKPKGTKFFKFYNFENNRIDEYSSNLTGVLSNKFHLINGYNLSNSMIYFETPSEILLLTFEILDSKIVFSVVNKFQPNTVFLNENDDVIFFGQT